MMQELGQLLFANERFVVIVVSLSSSSNSNLAQVNSCLLCFVVCSCFDCCTDCYFGVFDICLLGMLGVHCLVKHDGSKEGEVGISYNVQL